MDADSKSSLSSSWQPSAPSGVSLISRQRPAPHRSTIAYPSIIGPFAEKINARLSQPDPSKPVGESERSTLRPSTTYQFDCFDDADRIRIMEHVASSFEYVERATGNLFMKSCRVLILLDNLIATTSKDRDGA